MFKQIIAAMFGAKRAVRVAAPRSDLATAAAALRDAAATAVGNGDWKAEHNDDPTVILEHLDGALTEGKCDEVVSIYALDLVDCSLIAISSGDWMAHATTLDAIFTVSATANISARNRAAANEGEIAQAA